MAISSTVTSLVSLKERLSGIARLVSRDARIVFVDYPLYLNIGDLLINLGSEEFFAVNGMQVKHRFSYHDFPKHIADIEDSDVVMFHGGGNFNDLYPEHVNLLKHILDKYPRNQVVVLPQTVRFQDERTRSEFCSKLRRHEKLSVFVRDETSYNTLTSAGLESVAQMPDMSHYFIDRLTPAPAVGAAQPLYFLRRDEEASRVPDFIASHQKESVDWSDCITMRDRVAFALLFRTMRYANLAGIPLHLHRAWYDLRDSIVQSGVQLISRSQVVHTNRLHVMLLALFLNREVVAFDNSNGKLSAYRRSWLMDIPSLKFVET